MTLIDSHCHLDCLALAGTDFSSVADVVAHTQGQGIAEMLCVSITLEDWPNMMEMIKGLAGVYASVGHHPCDIGPMDAEKPSFDKAILMQYAEHEQVVAVGETGLDYYHTSSERKDQQLAFASHIEAARQLKKPLIIHTRDAREDTIAIMRDNHAEEVGGVMHCFTETWEMAKQALDLGFLISFSGIITFKNAEALRDVVKKIPIESMLVETDAPYLAPVPYRGKSNFPEYVRYVAEAVAEIKGMSYADVADQTSRNFKQLFL